MQKVRERLTLCGSHRSLSLRPRASRTAEKTFLSSLLIYQRQRSAKLGKVFSFPEQTELKTTGVNTDKAISVRRGYGSGPCRQGIARHVPPCPAALHLDCP